MEYRRMGKTGLQLSLLSYGSWVTFHKQLDDKKADELMGIAYDNGVNFFDNAEVYSRGESEKLMGRVLQNKKWDRTSYTVSSKAFWGWHGPDNKPTQKGLSRKHLVEACHEALQRMQLDYLDIYFCHRPDKSVPMEEVVWTMNILIQQGKILYWGTSEWSAQEITEAHMVAKENHLIGPAVEQPEYNLFNRHKMENDFLKVFRDIGMGATIWSPLASGLLTGKYNEGVPEDSRIAIPGFEWLKERVMVSEKINKVRRLKTISDKLGTGLATLSIAWCIRNPDVTTAILGATKKEQLEQNFMALELYPKLTEGVLKEIDEIMGTKPVLPEH
ncbi:MAG TPA: aldo/keto reductase [Chitinophagaceae bacterium]|nr:aldo/keto reductase [Chitinophagaceae bacterium]